MEQSCSWCHHLNDVTRFRFCELCGHQTGVPRIECNCEYCQAHWHGPLPEQTDIEDSELRRDRMRSQMRDV